MRWASDARCMPRGDVIRHARPPTGPSRARRGDDRSRGRVGCRSTGPAPPTTRHPADPRASRRPSPFGRLRGGVTSPMISSHRGPRMALATRSLLDHRATLTASSPSAGVARETSASCWNDCVRGTALRLRPRLDLRRLEAQQALRTGRWSQGVHHGQAAGVVSKARRQYRSGDDCKGAQPGQTYYLQRKVGRPLNRMTPESFEQRPTNSRSRSGRTWNVVAYVRPIQNAGVPISLATRTHLSADGGTLNPLVERVFFPNRNAK